MHSSKILLGSVFEANIASPLEIFQSFFFLKWPDDYVLQLTFCFWTESRGHRIKSLHAGKKNPYNTMIIVKKKTKKERFKIANKDTIINDYTT